MSFLKILREADKAGNIHSQGPFVELHQEDTSLFDLIESAACEENDPEVLRMKSIVRNVKSEPRRSSGARVKRHHQSTAHRPLPLLAAAVTSRVFAIPEVDWQQEVDLMMANDVENDLKEREEEEEEDEEDDDGEDYEGRSEIVRNRKKKEKEKQNGGGGVVNKIPEFQLRRSMHSMPSSSSGLANFAPYSTLEYDVDFGDQMDVIFPNKSLPLPTIGAAAFGGFEISDEEEEADFDEDEEDGDEAEDGDEGGKHMPAGGEGVVAAQSQLSKEDRKKAMLIEKGKRIGSVTMRNLGNVAIDLNYQYYRRPRDSDSTAARGSSNRGPRTLIAALNHCRIATSHLNVKPDLSARDMRFFHRPRLTKSQKSKPWSINLRNVPKKRGGRSRMVVDADKLELSVASGDFALIEYVEEFPPLMLNYGMASAVINYFRASDQRDQDESRRSSQAAAATSSSSAVSAALPRHVRLLLNQRDRLKTLDHDANVPRLPYGETRVLAPEEPSPFLGEIEVNEIQPTIANNLFRAPIFQHPAKPTDFLLICTNKEDHLFTVREIPRIFVCGQIEPQKIVTRPMRSSTTPDVNRVSLVQEKFLTLSVSRLLQPENFAGSGGLDFETISFEIMSEYTRERRLSPHKEGLRSMLRLVVQRLSDVSQNKVGVMVYRPINYNDARFTYSDTAELELRNSPDELAKSFSPEDVCVEGSSASAEYRLRTLGIVEALMLQVC